MLLCDISKGAKLYVIDNSHIITGEPGTPFDYHKALKESEIISNRILKTNAGVYDLLCQTVGYREEKLLQCAHDIKESLLLDGLDEIKESIPKIWIDSVGIEKTEQLFRVLNRRLEYIDEIAEMIIRERRMS